MQISLSSLIYFPDWILVSPIYAIVRLTSLLSFLVCVAYRSRVKVTIGVPSETWEGDGALMTCTVTGDITSENIRIDWYKWNSNKELQRVFLFDNARNIHRAENDLLDASNKPRAVGQLVGFVYHLYINKTVLSDDYKYYCVIGLTRNSTRLIINGEYCLTDIVIS